jgi:2-polyprenyl-3-methyl-5-hydroxy-6-metoxy-1,4-benzoquinol methylase
MPKTPCPCCGSSSARVVANRDGKTGETLITISCGHCGLGRIDPLPSEEELANWYASQYRQQYKAAVQPALRHVLRAGRNAQLRWQWLFENTPARGWLNAPNQRHSLDIGASSGESVFLMQSLGLNASGIEPHAGYAAHARETLGLSISNGTLQECLSAHSPGTLDLITMFHVLEHLPDPLGALRAIGTRLRPEGLLYIEVPNALRLCSPHYMFFKAHTLYFTGKTLRLLLQTAGFEVVAHNADDADNLSVAARYRALAPAPVAADTSHPLVAAQQARRWMPYLMQQLREGQPLKKWRKRQEEKRFASHYTNGQRLLQDLFEKRRA